MRSEIMKPLILGLHHSIHQIGPMSTYTVESPFRPSQSIPSQRQHTQPSRKPEREHQTRADGFSQNGARARPGDPRAARQVLDGMPPPRRRLVLHPPRFSPYCSPGSYPRSLLPAVRAAGADWTRSLASRAQGGAGAGEAGAEEGEAQEWMAEWEEEEEEEEDVEPEVWLFVSATATPPRGARPVPALFGVVRDCYLGAFSDR